ncbi:MAG: GNAT family N-acetyltransferase [Candidatus Bathyarchaeota archaeon]|jgi:ribosomal protein S18 acetylase RimI-like enzyme
MNHLHWFRENKPFDYNRKEELQELRQNFGKPNSLFLVAKIEGVSKTIGALRVRCGYWRGDRAAVFRGWEPAITLEERNTNAGEALVREALRLLHERNLRKAVYILKYPYGSPETASWHVNLYKRCRFEQKGPEGVILIADISQPHNLLPPIPNLQTVGWDKYTREEIAEFFLRAYASTPEDKETHKWDPLVSNREKILKWLQSPKMSSPPECHRVALIDGKPAGFIGASIPKWKHQPSVGVLGPLGVFPEHRRKGIAYFLIMEIHRTLEEYGCHHSLVGTPKTNQKGIKLYKKAGYQTVFEQKEFEKKLR